MEQIQMSSEDFEFNQNKNGKVSIKKSTFNGLIIGLIVVVGVTAFFAGSYTSNLSSNQISEEDLEDAIAKLE
ncbi:MAG: DsbA family protein, partial [Nitrosopumilus sp.]